MPAPNQTGTRRAIAVRRVSCPYRGRRRPRCDHPITPYEMREVVLALARTSRQRGAALAIAALMKERSRTSNLVDQALDGWERSAAIEDARIEREWWTGVWTVLLVQETEVACCRIRRAKRR